MWFAVNKLSLNVNKTNYIIFGKRRYDKEVTININNPNNTRVNVILFLDIEIDEKLNWKMHIDSIKTKLSKSTAKQYTGGLPATIAFFGVTYDGPTTERPGDRFWYWWRPLSEGIRTTFHKAAPLVTGKMHAYATWWIVTAIQSATWRIVVVLVEPWRLVCGLPFAKQCP